jgi:creatinine amidohydrolase
MQLLEMSWPEVDALSRNTPLVIPIAALEQHGRHLPVFVDSFLLGEIVRRAEETLQERVVFAPVQWLGNSEHHLDFMGTMSAAPRVYLDVLRDMAENFLMHGFRRIVFLNGHGGNIVPSQQVVFELRQKYRQRHDLLLLAATYWSLGGQPHQADESIVQRRMGHACEWETSMMLRLRPELVKDPSRLPAVSFADRFEPANRGWITKDRTEPGHIGEPQRASAEKGEVIFSVFAADVTAFLNRVCEWDGSSYH